MNNTIALLQKILNKEIKSKDDIAIKAMLSLASDKKKIWDKSHYDDKIAAKTFDDIVPRFNPGSSTQKAELLTTFLRYEPLSLTDGGAPQWSRQNVETLLYTVEDEDISEILQCLIDYSYGAIIQDNFINAFDKFTIDDTLHGNIKLLGAKSARPTSNNPNLLNAPSTGSIYAKPLKKCFTAPEGYLLWSIDYSSLEDKVIANLSGDENKITTQVDEELDAHLFHAVVYFRSRFVELLGDLPHRELAIAAKKAMDDGNKEIKELRQKSKGVTFGASYGAFPPKIAQSIKCSLEEATIIFNAYHNDMYPGITKAREKELKTAKQQGYLHLGLGFRLYSDDVDKDSRTLWNALSQFWSILTLIAMNELNYRIDRDEMDIHVNATIYDALYGYVRADAESVKWLNDNLPSIMEKDFMTDQIVHNSANLEISSTNWSEFTELKHDMSLDEIQEKIDEITS